MKTTIDRAVSAGCLLMFLAFLGAIAWAIVGGWSQSIWIGVTFALGLLLGQYSKYRRHRVVRSLIHSAFSSRGVEAPMFKLAGGYGYPGYELIFSSVDAEQAALSSGALSAFKAGVQDYHRDDGSKNRPFDAEIAIHTTYPNKYSSIQGVSDH